MIPRQKFEFWAKNNLNVLFIGKHGVGKTSMVIDEWERMGLKYLYFSASTMDPWVDFIGIPKEKKVVGENGTEISYIDLVRPLELASDTVDAIFLDELNRSPEKVRNAVMQLIQFKAINGKKFNNLKMVWGAINPEDDEKTYDVERLDPAQKDRFHIHVDVEYKPDRVYFTKQYGEQATKVALEWWNNLGEAKNLVSPRRLDYALQINALGGDIHDVLHKSTPVTKLIQLLSHGLAKEKIVDLLNREKYTEVERMLMADNIYSEIEPWLINEPECDAYRAEICALLPAERLTKLVTKEARENDKLAKAIFSNYHTSPKVAGVMKSLNKTNKNDGTAQFIFAQTPRLKSDEIGKEPLEFKAVKTQTKEFSDYVTSVANKKEDFKADTDVGKECRNKFLDTINTDMPHDLNSNDARNIVKVIFSGVILHTTNDIITSNAKRIIGPLNFALKVADIDFMAEDYKIALNRLIECKLEKLLWIRGKSTKNSSK